MLEPMVLIETSWNVKMVSISTFFTFTRINRNIVECKGKRKYVQLRFPDVLIETSWNVKRKYFPAIPYTAVVLIETSWNVKSSPRALLIRFFFVLIETSWNVKLLITYGILFLKGINRNIVECKV